MKKLFDERESAENRIAKMERVISRLARRSRKVASAIITPYPISSCVMGEDVKGDILKYMFPSKGVIKKGLIVLDRKPSTGVAVNISISNDAGGNSKNYVVTKKSSIFEPNIEIFSTDRLTISISPVDPEKDKMTEVWIVFTWVPDVSDAKIKQCLIDELDGAVNDLSEE
jgi:hypothetical protein